MAYLGPDSVATPELGIILILRHVTLGSIDYHVITDSGVVVDGSDPNPPGGTAPPLAYAVGYLWPRGDGTPAST